MTMDAPSPGLDLFHLDPNPQTESRSTKPHSIMDSNDELPTVLNLNEFLTPVGTHIEEADPNLAIIDYDFSDLQLQSASQDRSKNIHHIHHQQSNDDHYPKDSNSKSSSILMVEYDPQLRPRRLGRPRKHLDASQPPVPPESNSVENLNALVVLRFRLDSRPVVGPGSRGGHLGSRSSRNSRSRSATQRRIKQEEDELNQSQDPQDQQYQETSDVRTDNKHENGELNTSESTIITGNGQQNSTYDPTNYEEEDFGETAISIMNQTAKEKLDVLKRAQEDLESKKPSFSNQNFSARTLRTTVVGTKSRNIRILPGPVMALTYHLYDDNFISRDLAKTQKIAYGFPVKLSPFAEDISIITSYLSRFSHIIWPDPKRAPKLGPQDFEKGLGLPKYPQSYTEEQFVNYSEVKVDLSTYNPSYISKDMNNLFCRLLTLTLNKKREILPSHQKNSLSELKVLIPQLGYPKEWRDDSFVINPNLKKQEDNKNDQEPIELPVDPNNPEILYQDNQIFNPPICIYNPYQEPDFEKYGLAALTPINRLIMLRLLCQWSTSTSDALKSFIFENSDYQDAGGEKTTLYVPRSILKGFKNAEDALLEAEAKINKKIVNAVKSKEKDRISEEVKEENTNGDEIKVKDKVGVLLHFKKGFRDQEVISKSKSKKEKLKKPKSNGNKHGEYGTTSIEKDSVPVDNKAILVELAIQDSDLGRYIDPTSNPLNHPMRWRLDELFVGDGGLHIGRFYLCRMANGAPGGLDSVKKMKSAFASSRDFRDSPSSFKLYVEDVHQILLKDFMKFGVEFDEKGREVQNPQIEEEWGNTWYEVASNAQEMRQFVEHLNLELKSFTSGASKQATVLRDYLAEILPLLELQETIELYDKTERSGRKREIDYSEAGQSKMRRIDDSPIDYFEDDEDEIVAVVENDDDDDDDYRE